MLHITWIQRAHVAALTAIVYLLIGCDYSSSAVASAGVALDNLRGPVGPEGPPGQPGPTGPQGPEGPPGEAADSVNRSGSRLRARYLITEDGARQLTGFYDVELEERCSFSRGAEEYAPGEGAAMRCYPTDVQRLQGPNGPSFYTAFADPECKVRIAPTSTEGGDAPYTGQRYAAYRSGLPSWTAAGWESANVVRVYEIEPWTDDAPAYKPICQNGTCSGCEVFAPTPEEQANGYKLAPGPWVAYTLVNPETFVQATEEVE